MPNAFQGQSVIVTGASEGIGRALSLRLAEQGAFVTLAARSLERLDELAVECRARGGRVLVVPTDVSAQAQCKHLIDRTVTEFGHIDMLISNAGIAATGLLEELPDLKLFKYVMDVNFYGQVYCAYYALPHLKQTKGRLVSISSLGGKMALPHNTPYVSSKYALHGFYDALRIELTPSGASVTVICPYWVVTEFHGRSMDKDGIPRGRAKARAVYTDKTMTAEQCACITLNAASKRKREVLMWPGPFAIWIKMLAPSLMDWLVVKVFLEPAIKRARSEQPR
jgi:short-subunit dehydrogenase